MKSFKSTALLVTAVAFLLIQCSTKRDYKQSIDKGDFTKAQKIIRKELVANRNLLPERRLDLLFEVEKMERIKKDFTKSEQDVLEYIRKYMPEVSRLELKKWEREKSLEYMIIDGKKKYFNTAAANLFRINKEAKTIKDKAEEAKTRKMNEKFPLDEHLELIIKKAKSSGREYVCPVSLKIKQSIIVDKDAVPEEKIIRCWIPFPREIKNRQTDIKLLHTDPATYILADNDITKQRTVYFEKKAQNGTPTEFTVEYSYTSHGVYLTIDPEKVKPVPQTEELKPFTKEKPPHIVFTDELIKLLQSIVGDESNPYRIAQKLFEWVDTNIPWASAREYSTIGNISSYCYENMHGDCGIQTLLFITLCRINGIPAKWQSGWEFQPPGDSMHDWGEIYFEPYGWVPVDVTYGLRKADNETLKWFYLSGMDSYRLIFNDACSEPFYPAKIYPRSETIDSQRGEVEWEGGNLYFDKWDWIFKWEIIQPCKG